MEIIICATANRTSALMEIFAVVLNIARRASFYVSLHPETSCRELFCYVYKTTKFEFQGPTRRERHQNI